MSTIHEIPSAQAFESHIASLPTPTIACISFHTSWAAPCAQSRLILQTLASSYPITEPPLISFLSLDAESLSEISESYDVTAVPFLVLQRGGQVLGSISGSDAGKIRELVEKYAGKAGDNNASAATVAASSGTGSEGVGPAGKVSLPPALETTPRPNGVDAVDTVGGNEKSGASTANGNVRGIIAPPASSTISTTTTTTTEDPTEELNNRLAELVKAAPVMLFMKGTPSAPQCGFSRTLVGLLREKGVRYGFFNILADEEVRQGLKVFS
ncbi:monothiol glutaredoxin grx4, partial [Peltigera leucophlebia]|nr:monothiol glutaredoxin grx4 [Peltigera leucophlebia]